MYTKIKCAYLALDDLFTCFPTHTHVYTNILSLFVNNRDMYIHTVPPPREIERNREELRDKHEYDLLDLCIYK